jgi:hypothetical protein
VLFAGRRAFRHAVTRAILSSAAALGLVGVPDANADVAPADPTASTVTIVGESGDNVLDNGTDLWRAGPDRIGVGRLYSSGVMVDGERGTSGDTDDFTFEFQPPANQTLTTGTTYTDAQRMPAGTDAGLDVYGNGAGCNTESGQFTVLDIAPDLSRLWIVYEAHCEAGVPAAFGEIRYNEPVDSSDEVIASSRISWPQKFVGQAGKQVPVTVINTGAVPLTVSGMSVGGPDAADFTPAAVGSCATIAAGASCAINVGFTPTATGTRTAGLTVTDSNGSHQIALTGSGVAPASTVSLFGDSGEYVTQGATNAWWDGSGLITAKPFDTDGVEVTAGPGPTTRSTGSYTFDFRPAPGKTLTAGTYLNTEQPTARDAGHPGLDVSGDSRDCGASSGQFTVLDMAPDLSRLWIVFEDQCQAGGPASFGEIRYNEPVANPEVLITPTRIEWPPGVVDLAGRTVPVTFINTGSDALNMSGAAVSGSASVDYRATPAGRCTNVAPDASCAVSVAYQPTQVGSRTATLTLTDSSAIGSETVGLSGDVAPEPPVTALRASVTNGDVVSLSWKNPSAVSWMRTVVRGAAGSVPPAGEGAGFAVYAGADPDAATGALDESGPVSFTAFAEYADGSVVATSLTVPDVAVTLSLSRTQVTYGGSLTATGRVVDAQTGAPIALGRVDLLGWAPSLRQWAKAGTVSTDASGNFSMKLTPGRTYDYVAVAWGDSAHLGNGSNTARGSVAAVVAAVARHSTLTHGKSVVIGVAAAPNLPGTEVDLQQYTGGRWRTVQRANLNSAGAASFTVKLSKKGSYSYRVQLAASPALLAATSTVVKIKAT